MTNKPIPLSRKIFLYIWYRYVPKRYTKLLCWVAGIALFASLCLIVMGYDLAFLIYLISAVFLCKEWSRMVTFEKLHKFFGDADADLK